MELERVSSVSVGDLLGETLRQVDDLDGLEGTSFRAETTSDAESLREIADLRLGAYFNALLSLHVEGAGTFALLSALFGLALIGVDDSNSELILRLDHPYLICNL
jgi:hypothetical protein